MREPRIAAQLYTCRDFTQTPEGIIETLGKVKAMGYDFVQLSALGPMPPEDLRRAADDAGLGICATHIGLERLLTDIEGVIVEHRALGCQHVAIGGLPSDWRTAEGYARFAREGTAIGRRLAEAGMTFSYHNHHVELEKFDGRLALDIIFEDSDPRYLMAEIDTYWIQYGGGDPAEWILKMAGREPLVHFKDMAVDDSKPVMTEVGEGNLNWPRIIEACRQGGVEYYIVEQDWCKVDPFLSLETSYTNLSAMGLK